MKSIVVGYQDEAGRSEPKLVCGPEVTDADQWKTFVEAKRSNKFPAGLRRLEIAFVESSEVAIQIGSASDATKKTMKKILAIIGLAGFILASIPTQAQVPTYAVQTLWSTNGAGIPAATAVAGNAVLDARKQSSVTVAVTAQCDTGGGAVTCVFVPSIDGVSYTGSTGAAQNAKAFSFTPAVTATTFITNINTYGIGYWKLSYITNDTGAAVTNLAVKYAVKISAP